MSAPTNPYDAASALGAEPAGEEIVCSSDGFCEARLAAVDGYMQNRQTLTEKMCDLNPYYEHHAKHRAWLVDEIKRVDEMVGGLCASQNESSSSTAGQ